jgi:hypothetical protein
MQFFPGSSNLSALPYSSWADVPKFITLGSFIILGSVNIRWKAEKLFLHLSCLMPSLILIIKA